MNLPADAISLLERESLAHVATSDENGNSNISIKGLIDVDVENGKLYFLDMFCGNTRKNLERSNKAAIAVSDHKEYVAYQFKGSTKLIESGKLFDKYTAGWNLVKQNRFRQQVSSNLKHFFSDADSDLTLPNPEYLVELTIEEIHNLAKPDNK